MIPERLLVLTADYSPGNWSGIGVAVAHQAQALAKLGCDVRLLMPFQPASVTNGPRAYCLSQSRFPLEPRRGDIVHLHSLSLADLAIEVARRFRLPFIYTAHSLLRVELHGTNGYDRWVATQDRVFRIADWVFFLSPSELKLALSVAPFLSSRASVLPNGLPEPPLRRPRDPAVGPVVFAGRLTGNKGIDVAVTVFSRLLDIRCHNTFVIAGGHGDFHGERSVAQFVQRYGSGCHFAGWLNPVRIEQLFSQAALIVMPSRYEPFGLVALESMRLGTPVIGSNVGGLGDLLKPTSGGIAVDGFNTDTWFRRCRQLLLDKHHWVQLSLQGPRYVASNFNSDALAKQFLCMIQHL